MLIHSKIIIFELIKLSVEARDNQLININNLRNAFNNCLNLLKKLDDIKLDYEFDIALDEFLDNYSEYITETDDSKIELTGEIEDLYDEIFSSFKINDLEDELSSLIYDSSIIKCLNITPDEKVAPYFKEASLILKSRISIALSEFNGEQSASHIENLDEDLIDLYDFLEETSEEENTKIKVAISLLDFLNLKESNEEDPHFSDFPWFIILFSNDFKEWESLLYLELKKYYKHYDLDLYIDKYFLTYFFIYLNNILKTITDPTIKETLITRKYLLLGTPELEEIEQEFLKNHNLDNIKQPKVPKGLEELDLTDFECFTYKCIENIIIDDEILRKHPEYISDLIISCLFIKTYLKIAINEKTKKYIIDLISVGSPIYKNPNYTIVNEYIDNIIFNNSLDYKRK